jgi:hypothetical protein
MKTSQLTATLLLLGTLTLGFADAAIDAQIEAIKNATPEERPTLVNEFKTTVSSLNDEERAAAIAQLQATMQGEGLQTRTQTQTQAKTQTKTQLKENAQTQQMQQMKTMDGMQQMNQHRTGSQSMQQGVIQNNPQNNMPQNNFMGGKK